MKKDDPRILKEKDFIFAPKYDNSIKKLLQKKPQGVSDSAICRMLGVKLAELKERHEQIITYVKQIFKVD